MLQVGIVSIYVCHLQGKGYLCHHVVSDILSLTSCVEADEVRKRLAPQLLKASSLTPSVCLAGVCFVMDSPMPVGVSFAKNVARVSGCDLGCGSSFDYGLLTGRCAPCQLSS